MMRSFNDFEFEEQELDDINVLNGQDDEQQRGLLAAEKELKHGNGNSHRSGTRWTRFTWRSFIVAGLIGLAVIAVSTYVMHLEGEEATHEVEEAFAVLNPSYELSNDWNFDAPPQRREYTWTIRDRLHNPDGIYRPMILVNNMFPGPMIEANDGDTIVVHIDNRAVNATSIHWHGLYQNGTPHMDGTVGVTQCPIAPGARFTYKFTISGQHGTTWWHGHQGVQTADGLQGPIVIHSRRERDLQTLSYDTDQVILLSDHYHDLSSALMFQYLMPDVENAEPVPESGLINGRGIRNCDDFPHRRCDNSTEHTGYPKIQLERGQRHRLRLINVGAFAEIQFQVDEHELAVTEVDGTDVHPRIYHRLNINPAQRYSVIIHTSAEEQRHFWMRARMIAHCFTDPPPTVDVDALAIVHYDAHQPDKLPSSQDWGEKLELECKDMNTTDLVPMEVQTPPAEPDAVYYLRTNFEIGAYRLSRGFFNTSSWRADVSSPSLSRVVDGLDNNDKFSHSLGANSEYSQPVFINTHDFDANRELVIQSTGVQTIDLLLSNFDDGNHPLHLHGYKYFVLAQGHGAPPMTRLDAAIDRASLAPLYDTLNITNPLRRDTASVEAFGWILIRIVADNPGIWALHCHVAWHVEAGLLMQLLTRVDKLANFQIPQANRDLCKASGLETGMAPDDSIFEEFAK